MDKKCDICKDPILQHDPHMTNFKDDVPESAHVKCIFGASWTFDLRLVQEEQKDWAHRNFGDQEPWDSLLGVVEELGELAHAELKQKQGIRGKTDAEAKDAVGDMCIYLMGYCNAKGFDLQTIIKETWGEVRKRDWNKHKKTGVGAAAREGQL